ncbi:MAG: heavy metal translocating P-type ATPase [Bacteroidota bacterium]
MEISNTQTKELCELCELSVSPDSVIRNNNGDAFCCEGCKQVHDMLKTLPEDQAQQLQQSMSTENAKETKPSIPEEAETAYFQVQGMHCTTCERFLDHLANQQDGVFVAQSSYATDLMRICFDPQQISAHQLAEDLSRGGYRLHPFSPSDDPTDLREQQQNQVARLVLGGFFGMIVMMQYILFLYPTYIGYDSLLNLNGKDGLFALSNIGVFSTFILGYTGGPLLRSAWISLRMRQPNMDLLIILAALSAYVYSLLAVSLGYLDVYFDVTVVIVLAVSIGQYYQQQLKRRSLQSLERLHRERADQARVVDEEGHTTMVPLSDVAPDATIQVLQGEYIPFDGYVQQGEASVDESLLTGEALPQTKSFGDTVLGGSLLLDNSLTILLNEQRTSLIDRLSELLWQLQSQQSGTQRFVDRLAAWFVPMVLIAAGFTFLLHLSWNEPAQTALLTSLAVLIVSCPCALGLATPLALANGIRSALREQVIVQSTELFERRLEPQQVVFDKTGTLTTGEFEVVDTELILSRNSSLDSNKYRQDILTSILQLEHNSAHPVGRSIATYIQQELQLSDFNSDPISQFTTTSRGIYGQVNGRDVWVGSPSWMQSQNFPEALPSEWRNHSPITDAEMAVWAYVSNLGWIAFHLRDQLREQVDEVLGQLNEQGMQVIVLTGDRDSATEYWQNHPAVDRVFAEVRPESKAAIVSGLRRKATTVMVGDGINDAGAMSSADLGITFGNRSALARSAGDLVIPNDDLSRVPYALALSNRVFRRIRQNLGWALLYNAVAIPLAAWGWINPLFAALAMIGSSILVIVNSSRLIKID